MTERLNSKRTFLCRADRRLPRASPGLCGLLGGLLNACPESFRFQDQFRHPVSRFPAPAVSPGSGPPSQAGLSCRESHSQLGGAVAPPWVTPEGSPPQEKPRAGSLPVRQSEGPWITPTPTTGGPAPEKQAPALEKAGLVP